MDPATILTSGVGASVVTAVAWVGKRLDSAFTAQSSKLDALVDQLVKTHQATADSSEKRTERVVAALTEVAGLLRDNRDLLARVIAALDRVERLLDDAERPSQRGSRTP